MLCHWLLEAEVVHLNHGTVGATPRSVLAAQQGIRDEIERNPARFMLRELAGPLVGEARGAEPRIRRAANEVGEFVGARGEDLVFVDNTTTAVNAVLRSLDFRAGDEVLLFEQCYGALRRAAEYVMRRVGGSVRLVPFLFPGATPDGVIRGLKAAITPRTRLAIVDHITSPSALVLPLAELAQVCHEQGVAVLADGAHAPGAIPVDISSLGVDWYTGNLHKWAWAPRSSAILWADRARQAEVHPTTISWGLDQGMTEEFDWQGTRDPTPHLAAPAGIAFMRDLGVARVQSYNHDLALEAGALLSRRWRTELPAPASMIGTMIAVTLPERAGTTQAQAERLRDVLLYDAGIEIALQTLDSRIYARISAQVYNELDDIERLASAVLARV
jgi:isopenicillin-N epimerase